jgi:hypothetical protein
MSSEPIWRATKEKGSYMKRSITKRSGKEESFQADKILNSMRNAGVGRDTAEGVTRGIVHHDGITTSEVRNRVIGGIKNREPQAAKQYESHPRKTH